MAKKSIIITLRVPEALAAKIAEAVKASGRDQADILRDAVSLGMSDLEMIGFDPLQVAREQVNHMKKNPANSGLASLPHPENAPVKKKA
jgi:hypothetical protein